MTQNTPIKKDPNIFQTPDPQSVPEFRNSDPKEEEKKIKQNKINTFEQLNELSKQCETKEQRYKRLRTEILQLLKHLEHSKNESNVTDFSPKTLTHSLLDLKIKLNETKRSGLIGNESIKETENEQERNTSKVISGINSVKTTTKTEKTKEINLKKEKSIGIKKEKEKETEMEKEEIKTKQNITYEFKELTNNQENSKKRREEIKKRIEKLELLLGIKTSKTTSQIEQGTLTERVNKIVEITKLWDLKKLSNIERKIQSYLHQIESFKPETGFEINENTHKKLREIQDKMSNVSTTVKKLPETITELNKGQENHNQKISILTTAKELDEDQKELMNNFEDHQPVIELLQTNIQDNMKIIKSNTALLQKRIKELKGNL
ncbi:dynactin subunit [Anaeramoeba flamelloides]|uniref:Dynactin subunit n=1 Tax=Anaeramoeba flamelloides TaxID=1746091 RepID=A0AAV7Y5X8_9EUKA|nr:dynactin subunit [Anaeramoeba flamelloides]